MKKFKIFLCFLMITVAFFTEKTYSLDKNINEFVLHKGQSLYISCDHLCGKTTLKSENDSIASVKNGIIKANSVGETYITEVKTDLNGHNFETKYKINVLPPMLILHTFCEPISDSNNNVIVSVITDTCVDQLKFLISSSNGVSEKIYEKKIHDGKNFIYKIQLNLKSLTDVKINFWAKVGSEWQYIERNFCLSNTNKIPSDKCISYIIEREGFHSNLESDDCVTNVYDIGYGHVVKEGEPFFNNITKTEARAMLCDKLNNGKYTKMLNDFISQNNLEFSQNQFDALLSFSYNVGTSWLIDSGLQDIILSINNTDKNNFLNKTSKLIGTVISDNGLRLREQANTNSKILTVLKFNEKVELLSEICDGWYKVKTSDGHEGFCCAEFLTIKNNYNCSDIGIVNSTDGLRLRTEPNTDSSIKSVLKFNERVNILNKDYNGWYKVKTSEGQEGFCCAEFLTIKQFDINDFKDKFLEYHHAGGKSIRGLLYRRIEELQMFLYNDYSKDGTKNKYNFKLPQI